MNKKNTKIQGRANNIQEVMHIMKLLKEGKVWGLTIHPSDSARLILQEILF